jgi:cephalosporin hydroxylase
MGLRRRLASRWDSIAVDRALTVARRGARNSDASSVALANEMISRTFAFKKEPQSWSPLDRERMWSFMPKWIDALFEDIDSIPEPAVTAICKAFTNLYHPTGEYPTIPSPEVVATIEDQFHRLYYHHRPRAWERMRYRGHRILKFPSDLWIYGNIIEELRPGLIVETGTRFGGSALWFAEQLELLGHGQIASIDIDEQPNRPEHHRLTYLLGSSSDQALVDKLKPLLPQDGSPTLVVLDSDHSFEHVLAELKLLSEFVNVGSYLIVEDTNINGHPVYEEFGPGPMEAVKQFLSETDAFEVDESRNIFHMTMHPRGFLRKVH